MMVTRRYLAVKDGKIVIVTPPSKGNWYRDENDDYWIYDGERWFSLTKEQLEMAQQPTPGRPATPPGQQGEQPGNRPDTPPGQEPKPDTKPVEPDKETPEAEPKK